MLPCSQDTTGGSGSGGGDHDPYRDGELQYIDRGGEEAATLQIQVPAVQHSFIDVRGLVPATAEEYRLTVLDLLGRTVASSVGVASGGRVFQRLSVSAPAGLYLVRLTTRDGKHASAKTFLVR